MVRKGRESRKAQPEAQEGALGKQEESRCFCPGHPRAESLGWGGRIREQVG